MRSVCDAVVSRYWFGKGPEGQGYRFQMGADIRNTPRVIDVLYRITPHEVAFIGR